MAGRQSFASAVRAEWIKLHTLTSAWVTSVITIIITVLFGADPVMGFVGSPDRADQAKTMITASSVLGMIVIAVLGVLMMTGEYALGQVRSLMIVAPYHGRLFVTKVLVGSVLSFVLKALSVTLAYAASYPLMKGHTDSLTDAHCLGLFWGTDLSFAIISLMAQRAGHLTRSTASAITVAVSALFVVPLLFRMIASYQGWADKVLGLLSDTLSATVSDSFSLAIQ